MSGRIDPRDLFHAINRYGYGEWHRGYLASRSHALPSGLEGDRAGAAVVASEDDGLEEREAWARPLLDLLDLDGATEETRHALVMALNVWGQLMHQAGWWEAVGPFPDDRPVPVALDPLTEHAPAELAAARARWEGPLFDLVTRHIIVEESAR